MAELTPRLNPIKKIEGSETYYKVSERQMNTFAAAYPAYHFVVQNFLLDHPDFQQTEPGQLCVLGGFFPNHANIDATHALAATVGLPPAQCRYLDINPDPARILSKDEQTRFHQVDLSKLVEAQTAEGELLIPEGSVKLMILDHVTEFMDEQTLASFFENLSRVLAPDGVALMSTVEVVNTFEQIWEKLRGMFVMKTKIYTKSEQEWKTALEPYLSNPAVLSFPLGRSDRKLFVLSQKGAYGSSQTLYARLLKDEFVGYSMGLNTLST